MKRKFKNIIKHETKKSAFFRFLLVVAIFFIYLVLVSFKYGFGNGIIISLLTWSFFVFCTPIADAGFLVDFPVRLFTGMRMVYSEMIVWLIAAGLNIYVFFFNSGFYAKTGLLFLVYSILSQPVPYWLIIILSAFGTYLSVYFGDELMDVVKHRERKKYEKHKKKFGIIIFLFVIVGLIFLLYEMLLKKLGIAF